MTAPPVIEIEGSSIRVYRWADLNLTLWERVRRKPNRRRVLIGVFEMTNSPEVTMEHKLNEPSAITISPISARSEI